MLNAILAIIIASVVCIATVPLMDAIKKASAFVDAQSAAIKQGLVVAIAAALSLVAKLLETSLPTDLALWTPDSISVLISAVFAMVVKAAAKKG
jgi:hypothetical protein